MKQPRPPWLKVRLRLGEDFERLEAILTRWGLNTICREASCPNIGECFNHKTATFLILGDRCTRGCSFCGVKRGIPCPPDPGETKRVAQAIKEIGLTHAVITSVTRDDLSDGGAMAFAQTIREIKLLQPDAVVEVLIPDLKGSKESLSIIIKARPNIVGHNVETVPRLYPQVRRGADYKRSLRVLKTAKELYPVMATKSGLMVGMGEEKEEVFQAMDDLRAADCDLLTVGQYLPPAADSNFSLQRYYSPSEFQAFFEEGMKRGFRWVESGPLVRSSYHAEQQWENYLNFPCG